MSSNRLAIESALRATADAGVGRMISAEGGSSDGVLGEAVYAFEEHGWTKLVLFERGLAVEESGSGFVRLRYDQVDGLELLTLRDLVKLRGVDAAARIRIGRSDNILELRVPYKVYSPLSTLLLRLTQHR